MTLNLNPIDLNQSKNSLNYCESLSLLNRVLGVLICLWAYSLLWSACLCAYVLGVLSCLRAPLLNLLSCLRACVLDILCMLTFSHAACLLAWYPRFSYLFYIWKVKSKNSYVEKIVFYSEKYLEPTWTWWSFFVKTING